MIDIKAMPHLADISRHQAKIYGDQVAIRFEGRDTSYSELDRRTSQVANGLIAAGVKPGDRVAYLGKNLDVYYEMLLGAAKARAALAAMNYRLAPPELQFVLSDSESVLLFVSEEYYDIAAKVLAECPKIKTVIAIEGGHKDWTDYSKWRDGQSDQDPLLQTKDNDDVIQLYTSGTTGLPKGVQLTNANFRSLFIQADSLIWAAYIPGEAVINAMPLFHVAGVNIGLLSLTQGTTLVVLREINPLVILDLFEHERINHAFIVPAVILMLTQVPGVEDRDFSSLRIVSYGASPITEGLLKHAMELFGCQFAQVYGLTETTGAGTYLLPEDHDPARGKLRSCGIAYPDIEIRCVDDDGNSVPQGEVGEIVMKADIIMKGYWKRPEATSEAIRNGWFYTGDAGFFDEENYLFIHDRVKDMIVSGGENVSPAEVENAIFSHPDVADVAVIGVPDERWGEAVKAIIVPKPGCEISDADVIAYTRERIAGYKCPKSVDIHPEPLPRNPSGKVLRRQLREPFWAGIGRNVG